MKWVRGSRAVPALALAALLGVLAVPGVAAIESPAPRPVLGVDPLASGTILEDHADALPHWVERGLAGAILLHIDAGHGMNSVAPETLAALKAPGTGGGGRRRLLDEGNFVRAAAALGIVREVVWIAPFPLAMGEDAEKQLKDYLEKTGFSAHDRDTFRPGDGCYRGRVGELPVSVCGEERLPAIHEPVLVSIDARYITHAAIYRQASFIGEIRALFAALREARYAVLDTVMAYSVQRGDVPPDLRWVGDAVVQVLQDPAVILAPRAPERWGVLQGFANLRASGQPGEMKMLGPVLTLLERQPHDPALLLYAAEATVGHGGGEQVLSYTRQACQVEPGYCVGLREAGLAYLERGDVETGLRFFAAGEALLPGMEYGQLDLGIALMKVGRATQALEALEKVRERNGAFPSGFLIGATHLFKDDRVAARLSFDEALTVIEKSGAPQVLRPEIAQVVATAAAFYREEGLIRQAERLEGDPRLRLPAPPDRP